MKKELICYIIIVILAILTFVNTTQNDFVNYDDHNYIHENERIKGEKISDALKLFNPMPLIRGEIPKKQNEYLPLKELSYWFDFQLWGMNPAGYHITNVCLYIFLCILVFNLFKKNLSNDIWALFASLLYAVHPLHTENVAWISARKDLLSAIFFMLSLLAYITYTEISKTALVRARYILSLLFFICGWLTKPLVITLPLVFILYAWIFRKRNIKSILLDTLPFWILDIFFTLTNTIFIKGVVPLLKGGTPGILSAINYTGYYMSKFILPLKLAPVREPVIDFSLAHTIASLSAILLLLYITKRSQSNLFGLMFFLANLLPVLNLTHLANYNIHDRYMLIPSLGLCIIAGNIISKKKGIIVFPFILLLLSLLAIRQNSFWKDSIALWTHTVRLYPESSIAHLNLGSAYSENKEYNRAEEEYRCVLSLKNPIPQMRSAAYFNLGSLRLQQGIYGEALEYLQSALKDSEVPAKVHTFLGAVYVKLKNREKAIEHYRLSLLIDPHQKDRERIEAIIQLLLTSSPPESKP